MDRDIKKRHKKTKVGVVNDSYEMEDSDMPNNYKDSIGPFLNDVHKNQLKNNHNKSRALEALVEAKQSAGRWKEYVNKKRIRKKNADLDDSDESSDILSDEPSTLVGKILKKTVSFDIEENPKNVNSDRSESSHCSQASQTDTNRALWKSGHDILNLRRKSSAIIAEDVDDASATTDQPRYKERHVKFSLILKALKKKLTWASDSPKDENTELASNTHSSESEIGSNCIPELDSHLKHRRKSRAIIVMATGNELEKNQGTLGLDDIHEDFVSDRLFGDTNRSMSGASNRALLQYFAKLGHSIKDDELVDLDFIETLINNGADINSTDKHGQTVLHEVCSKWHVDVAKFLINLGSDVNKADNFGRTPLHVAAADDYPKMINVLLDNGADREVRTIEELQTPVHYAAKNDATEALKTLIKRNCDYKMVMDYKGRTPLFVAAELDRSETARLLLELEAPAGVFDNKGQAVLTWMVTKMPPVAVEALEQFHIKDRPNRKQHFYLNLLVQNNDKDPNGFKQTPLSVAVKYKQYDMITHAVFMTLINTMWDNFGWWRAYGSLLFNFIYIMLWTVYGVTVEYDDRHTYTFPTDTWRVILLIAAVAITLWQIVDEIREYRNSRQRLEYFKKLRTEEIEDDMKYCHPRWPEERMFLQQEKKSISKANTRYFSDPWNIFDWICYTLLIVVISTHLADVISHTETLARVHIRFTAVVIIFLWLRLMKNVRAFTLLGPFVVMLGAMVTDVVKFAFLYLEFFIPYLCAFWMIFGGNKTPQDADGNPNKTESVTVDGFAYFGQAMFSLFRMTLVDEYSYGEMRTIDPLMADLLVGTWLALSAILCLNLFIALLSDTFQRVYDNARANAVMQKAITILSYWDGMDKAGRKKYFNYIMEEGSPLSSYYDDDMTEGDEADLKKVTIQIKEELDDLKEKWQDQFGDEQGPSALEELRQGNDTSTVADKAGGKMVTTHRFQTEIDNLRDELKTGILDLQKQQAQMMGRFKQDLKVVKSLLLDLTGDLGGGGGPGGPGGQMGMMAAPMEPLVEYGYQAQPGVFMAHRDSMEQPLPGSGKKKKKKRKGSSVTSSLPGEVAQSPGIFAPSPGAYQALEVSTLDDNSEDRYSTEIRSTGMFSSRDPDHSTA